MSTLDAPEDQGLGATQMHDAAIAAGLVATPERVVTVDEFNLAYRNELEAQVARMDAERTAEELEELEEEGDDSILAQLRERRMQEARAAKANRSSAAAAGALREVDPFDFEQQVKLPSRHNFVLFLVYRSSHSESVQLQGLLRSFAAAHPSILCLQMECNPHVAQLPPQDCPVLLVYHHERVVKQFVRLDAWAGKETTAAVLEWQLADCGVCETDLEEDPRIRIEKARKLAMKRKEEEDAEESSDDDRFC